MSQQCLDPSLKKPPSAMRRDVLQLPEADPSILETAEELTIDLGNDETTMLHESHLFNVVFLAKFTLRSLTWQTCRLGSCDGACCSQGLVQGVQRTSGTGKSLFQFYSFQPLCCYRLLNFLKFEIVGRAWIPCCPPHLLANVHSLSLKL